MIIEIRCKRMHDRNQPRRARYVIWFWRVAGDMPCDSYPSIVMTTEPPEPRPGEHGMYGNIDPRLGLGQ